MKITITFKNSKQISPDDFMTYTEVVYLEEKLTLEEVRKLLPLGCYDFEIHFKD